MFKWVSKNAIFIYWVFALFCSYALDVNTERAEDVLVHKRLLSMARDPLTRPAVDVRLVQVYRRNHLQLLGHVKGY